MNIFSLYKYTLLIFNFQEKNIYIFLLNLRTSWNLMQVISLDHFHGIIYTLSSLVFVWLLSHCSFLLDTMEHVTQQGSQQLAKWKGKAKTEVIGFKVEQVWPLLEDFFGLDKWFPTLSACLPVEGISGQPGCVRFCAGFKTPVDGHGKQTVNWTKQKLLSIDPIHWTFSYSIIDGNVGFHSYISTVKVLPKDDGCEIEWLYEVEPVEGWTLEDLDSFIGTGLKVMAQRMQGALKAMQEAVRA